MPETKPKSKKYIATTGIDFDGLKPPVRVEKGEEVPVGVKPETIKDLLDNGDIKEAE